MRKSLSLVVGLLSTARQPNVIAICLFAVLLVSAGAVKADTVFSNLAAGSPTYNAFSGYASGPSGTSGNTFVWAMPFEPSANYNLTQIDVALGLLGGTNAVTITLNSDTNNAPGTVLATWNEANLPDFGTCCTLEQLLPNSLVTLIAGNQYWVEVNPGAPDSLIGWNWNSAGDFGTLWRSESGVINISGPISSSANLGAFDVLGVPATTPEPSSFGVLASGLLALLTISILRKKAAA